MKSPGKRGVTAVDTHVGLRLRTLRLTLRINQTEVADILGVTFQQIQKYERGSNRLSVGSLQKLATALKVPITYFFEGATHENVQGNDFERDTVFLQQVTFWNLHSRWRRCWGGRQGDHPLHRAAAGADARTF